MDASYLLDSNHYANDSIWLPNAYLQSILEAFEPRRGDQTVREIIADKSSLSASYSTGGPLKQVVVQEEPIRPSRPRELPPAFISSAPPGSSAITSAPDADPFPFDQVDSYNSLGYYAQSFYIQDRPEEDRLSAFQSHPSPEAKESAYSELAANLQFLADISKAEASQPEVRVDEVEHAEAEPNVVDTVTLASEDNIIPIDSTIFFHSTNENHSLPNKEPLVDVWPSDATPPFLWPASTYFYANHYPSPSKSRTESVLLPFDTQNSLNPPSISAYAPPGNSASSTTTGFPSRPAVDTTPPPRRSHKSLEKAVASLQAQSAKAVEIQRKYASKRSAPGPTSGQPASEALKKLLEPKKLKIACHFCRERKIACHSPPEGALDRTCE
ncbi:hypothetical protein NMY22_g2813 [Coprinellus aureogranulatus]|nr:hypothetical protein NMY22_g2813 [Coprinellus aureogranulatus]